MKLLNPTAQLWLQPEGDAGLLSHVARCARVCYQSNKTDGNERLAQSLIKKNHLSMFRHVTYYVAVPNIATNKKIINVILANSYIRMCYARKLHCYFACINGQTWLELQEVTRKLFRPYIISEERLVELAKTEQRYRAYRILSLLRTTVCCTTQISTSREMNRTSPNNIAEQSTRYVNFGKKGGIAICKPHWYDKASFMKRALARLCWKVDEWKYNLWLWLGLQPEDSRGFLPIDAGTRVVYTYTAAEWHHIMDLRLRDLTGKAHPNAKQIAALIKHAVDTRMQTYDEGYEV